MSDVAIQVENLAKVYQRYRRPAVHAVDGLTFSVARGSIFGLLGPNGAGKTTTLRVLTTLARPTSGRVSVLGHDVEREPLEVRRQIAVVIQEQAAELFLSVRDNLLTFARFHDVPRTVVRERVDRVLEQLGLTDEAARKVQDLSGGFRRRVQVAKMFMVDTPVMFLDEFSSGMDAILKRSVIDLLRQEAARGRTIVLTTQILDEAESLCDDILIMDRGRQIARGNLHTLKLLSQNVYEVSLTFDRTPDGLEAELAARRPLRLRVSPTTVDVALNEDESRVLELVTALAKRSRLLRIEIGGASLEDIFVELTSRPRSAPPEPVR